MKEVFHLVDKLRATDREYRKWLLRRVGFRRKGYDRLMDQLLKMPYYWDSKFPRDEDRALDGLMLREEYFDDEPPLMLFPDCSVLEMLVAFAIRIDNEWTGDPEEPHPEEIFWEMICNLSLEKQDNFRFDHNIVERFVEIWLRRFYDFEGNRSIFPVEKCEKDHRKISIWSQMLDYISQKY